MRRASTMKGAGIQENSSGPYPSQSTRYWTPSKHQTSIDELRGTRGRNGRSQRTFLDGFDPGDMEGWADPHGTRKLKAYRLWVYDAGYGKWSYELGGQLATLHFKGQVTGGEPDLLAKLIGRRRRAGFVCSSSLAICRLGESSARQDPGASTMMDQGLSRGAGGLLLQVGE